MLFPFLPEQASVIIDLSAVFLSVGLIMGRKERRDTFVAFLIR
jgi:hypothetical protein